MSDVNTDSMTPEEMEAYMASQRETNQQPVSELTPEEETKLKEQEKDNPDAHKEPIYDFNKETQRMIVGTMVQNEDFLKTCITIVKPNYFETEYSQEICSILFDAYKTYGVMPARYQMTEELERKVKDKYSQSSTLNKQLMKYRGELNNCYDNHNGYETREYLRSLIKDFCQQSELKIAFYQAIQNIKKKTPYLPSLKTKIEEVMSLEFENEYAEHEDFQSYAKQVEQKYVIENWLPKGTLTLFSASPKAGKSTLTFSILPAVAKGKLWLDAINTTQSHVVLCDYENPDPYIVDNITEYQGEDWTDLKPNLHIPVKLPRKGGDGCMTAEWLENFCKQRGLEEDVLIIIDSARRAFGGIVEGDWENLAASVGEVLNPLSTLAHTKRWTILVIHHDNKTGGISGSGDWMGAVDYVWRYKTRSDLTRELSTEGRRMVEVEPLIIRKHDRKIKLVGTLAQSFINSPTEEDKVLGTVPFADKDKIESCVNAAEHGIVMESIIGLNNPGIGMNRIREIVKDLVKEGKLVSFKPTGANASTSAVYYRPNSQI